jgi:hypothetical protein
MSGNALAGGSDVVTGRGILFRMSSLRSPRTAVRAAAGDADSSPRRGLPGRDLGRKCLGVARMAVLVWAGIWGLLSAVGQRRSFAGTSAPDWLDLGPGIAVAAAGVAAAVALQRRSHVVGVSGVAASLMLGWVALAGLFGTLAPGSWWLLVPFVLTWGLVVGRIGTDFGAADSAATGVIARLGFAAVAAGVGAAAALSWPGALRGIGGTRLHILASGLLLVGVVGRPLASAMRRPGSRLPRLLLVALAGGLFGWAVPVSLWIGVAGREVACFCGLLAGAWVSARSRLPVVCLSCAACALWLTIGSHGPFQGDPVRVRLLATHGSAAAVYARDTQELQLWSEGVLVDGEGPDRPQSELTATLLGAFLRPGDRVLLLGLGSGRLPPRLSRFHSWVVDAVDFRADARPLLERLAGAGPVQRPESHLDLGVPIVRGGAAAALARLAAGSRQAVVVTEPLHAGSSWQSSASMQAELRRVAGRGLVLQPFAMDRTPPARLRRLFAAASAANAWNAVFVVGECAVLVSAATPPAWPSAAAFAAWPSAARWQAQTAHLGDALDLQRACCGTIVPECAAQSTEDDLPEPGEVPEDRVAVLAVLRDSLSPAPFVPDADDGSVLLGWLGVQARLRDFGKLVRSAPEGTESATRVQQTAANFLPIGAPTALLQAALGLADGTGVSLRNAETSSRCAQALDPTFFALPRPPLFDELPLPVDLTGALEDLASLPPAPRLVEWCVGDQPLAVALRARFASQCAQALAAELAKGPLALEAMRALREVADPFVLAEAGRMLVARGAVRELLALWRGDLPLPQDLLAMLAGSLDDRQTLVAALAGRKDARSLGVLADSLMDPELEIRRTAAVSLSVTVGDRITYDPDWPQSRLLTAAEQVRALHNRLP